LRLWAISDLHVEHAGTRALLEALPAQAHDWLILAGDVADTPEALAWAIDLLSTRFSRLFWVPGNHELWTRSTAAPELRGEAHYQSLVALCRARGVLTPEDPFAEWPETVHGERVRLALLFTLYDYSFAPEGHQGHEAALAWAAEEGILASDEVRLGYAPYASRSAWCAARLATSAARLAASARDARHVLVNHWPLRHDLVRLGRVPRYAPWCGTRETDDWHVRYRALCCVHGHLHVRATDERDGVRFEEVSLGYPAHYFAARGAAHYLRRIL
jgi:3',5'-cyclic AMP phosphodiesterase CpdA